MDGECLIANDECLKLECGATAFKGTVRSDLLNRFQLDSEFIFDLNYGDCMSSSNLEMKNKFDGE